MYGRKVEKLRGVCKAATITIPPNLYSKHKGDEGALEGALQALLAKHGLSADSGGWGRGCGGWGTVRRGSAGFTAGTACRCWHRGELCPARWQPSSPASAPRSAPPRAGRDEIAAAKQKLVLARDLDGIDTSNIIQDGGRRPRRGAAPASFKPAVAHGLSEEEESSSEGESEEESEAGADSDEDVVLSGSDAEGAWVGRRRRVGGAAIEQRCGWLPYCRLTF